MAGDADFTRLEELFHAALARPAEERDAFLREACGEDAALLAEARALLEADGGALDVPALDQLGAESFTGQRAGRWLLGRRVGEGGLGVVYEAHDEQTGARAAIKFPRPGLDEGAFRRRFLRERRVLEALSHPHIARWLDGGVDETGRTYLAMEFVDGEPLDTYFQQTRPGVRERLALLEQVCGAVGYLHGEQTAHGDLKPSNILVRSDGQVKLVDFGAAKLLAEGGGAATTMTRGMLTPRYASPEQRGGAGPSIASDIYALGVILAEAFPEAGEELRAIGDRCRRGAPEERYGSAAELAGDLAAFRMGRPARLRRRGAGLFWTAGLALALAAGVGWWWQRERAVELERERMRAVVEPVLASGSGEAGRDVGADTGGTDELDLSESLLRLGMERIGKGETAAGEEALQRSVESAERVQAEHRREKGRPLDGGSPYYRLVVRQAVQLARQGRMGKARELLRGVAREAGSAEAGRMAREELAQLDAGVEELRRRVAEQERAAALAPGRLAVARTLATLREELGRQLERDGRADEGAAELEKARRLREEIAEKQARRARWKAR